MILSAQSINYKFDEEIKCSLCGKKRERYTFCVFDDVKICLYCWCKDDFPINRHD